MKVLMAVLMVCLVGGMVGVGAGLVRAHPDVVRGFASDIRVHIPAAIPGRAYAASSPRLQIVEALHLSNKVWMQSNEAASDRGLARAKAGDDLATNLASIRDLQRNGEYWAIQLHRFHVDWVKLTGPATAQAQASKNETNELHQGGQVIERLDGPYTVRYQLQRLHAVWKVIGTTVVSTNNRVVYDGTPTPTAIPATAVPTDTPVPPLEPFTEQGWYGLFDHPDNVKGAVDSATVNWSDANGLNEGSNSNLLFLDLMEQNVGDGNFGSNPYDFEVQGSDGKVYGVAFDGPPPGYNGSAMHAVSLPSGGYNNGWVDFAIPNNTADTYAVLWDGGGSAGWQTIAQVSVTADGNASLSQ